MSDEDDIPADALLHQVAALPYRMMSDDLEVLLITSRDSGRWLIPKGWRMKNHSLSAAAAVEAFEEAGLRGTITKKPLGAYTYTKTIRNGVIAVCRVDVYAMAVKRQAKKYKEKGQRRLQWLRPEEAADYVAEPELAALIAAFRPEQPLKP